MATYERCPNPECDFAEIEADFDRCPMCRTPIRRTPKPELYRSDDVRMVPDETIPSQKQPSIPLAHIVITEGQGTGGSFQLGESTRIGRSRTQNQVVLEDRAASGQHGKIQFENQRFVYYDLGSTNGSWLITPQGVKQRVKGPAPLRDGDQLKLGDTVLVFREAPRT